MKATTWLWPVVTLLCGSQFVCTAQREDEYQAFAGSSRLQDIMHELKRTKPSLSIVNPLDVLRQRLLLEIARRQMKENTRQVEINREILKSVGKREQSRPLMHHPFPHPQENDIFNDYMQRKGDKKLNPIDQHIDNDIATDNDDYEMNYFYRLHKNLFIKK